MEGYWSGSIWGRYQTTWRINRTNYSITSSLCSSSIDRFFQGLELPGVVAIATGADAENKFGVLPVTKDEHAMAVEMVRHVGDLVACVAAEDEATAREAERLIEVEYEIMDSIHDMRDGLNDSENPIHDRGKYHIGEANIQNVFSKN